MTARSNEVPRKVWDLKSLGTVTSPARFPPGSFVEEIWRIGKFCLTGYVGRHSIPGIEFPDDLRDRVPLGPTSTLEITIFDELRHNAAAFRNGSAYGVGLYHGLITTIPEFAMALWARPEVAPWIGDVSQLPPAEESGDIPTGLEWLEVERLLHSDDFSGADQQQLLAATRTRSACNQRLVAAMDPVRRMAMQRSVEDAFRFIWLHEIGHVVWGHLDLVERGTGALGMSELDDACGETFPPALGQYLEFQADRFAFGSVLGYRIRDLEAVSAGRGPRTPVPNLPTYTDLATIAIIGCMVTQLILGVNRRLQGRESVVETHPPLWVRIGDMINEARSQCGSVDVKGDPEASTNLQQLLQDRMDRAVGSILASHPLLMGAFQGALDELEAAQTASAHPFDGSESRWDAMVRPYHKFYRREGGGLALRD